MLTKFFQSATIITKRFDSYRWCWPFACKGMICVKTSLCDWLKNIGPLPQSIDRYDKRNRVWLEFLNLWSAGPPDLHPYSFRELSRETKSKIIGHLFYFIFILLASPVTEQWTINKCRIGRGAITAVSQLQRLVIEPIQWSQITNLSNEFYHSYAMLTSPHYTALFCTCTKVLLSYCQS